MEGGSSGWKGDVHRYLGPPMREFIGTCMQEQKGKMVFSWATAFLALAVTLFISMRHVRELTSRAPICIQRAYYVRIAVMPPMFALTGSLTLLDPATYPILKVVQSLYEAYVLYQFGLLLFMLLVHESRRVTTSDSSELSSYGEAEAVEKALAMQGPKKHYGVPPLGCFFVACMRPFNLKIRQVWRISVFIRQYVLLAPLLSVLLVWMCLALDYDDYGKGAKWLKLVGKISSLVCLYGLFIMYKSSHELLHAWNTTTKFVAIKLVLIIMMLQEFLIVVVLEEILKGRHVSCFQSVGFARSEWYAVEGRFWGMWMIAVESIGMAILIRRAFPPSEVTALTNDYHHTLLDMTFLRYIQEDDTKAAQLSESETEESDENA